MLSVASRLREVRPKAPLAEGAVGVSMSIGMNGVVRTERVRETGVEGRAYALGRAVRARRDIKTQEGDGSRRRRRELKVDEDAFPSQAGC